MKIEKFFKIEFDEHIPFWICEESLKKVLEDAMKGANIQVMELILDDYKTEKIF